MKAAPVVSNAAAPTGTGWSPRLLLQAKCECAPTKSGTGSECAECGTAEGAQLQPATLPGHEFSRINVNAAATSVGYTFGERNDPLEQEADRTADRVLSLLSAPATAAAPDLLTATGLQRQAEPDEAPADAAADAATADPELKTASSADDNSQGDGAPAQAKASTRVGDGASIQARAGAASPALRLGIDSSRNAGRQLPPPIRSNMESAFGADFRGVRVHADAQASSLAGSIHALAFTTGRDIYFGAGRYDTESTTGRHLLAHELAHVVQQSAHRAGAPVLQRKPASDIDRIRDYLSYGLFDWAVTDADAVAALTILRGLPRIRQAEVLSDKKYADRLRENLPSDRLAEFAEIESNAQSAMPPGKQLESVIDKLSYGVFDWAITDAEAVEALEILKTLAGEQLAVALNRIDYGRLMDNLPQDRQQELIDLLATALGTGGTTESAEKQDPGVALRSLRFTSDHGVMNDNDKDWSASGTPYPEPEWTVTPEGNEKSAPISQRKDSNIAVELGLNVAPANAPAAPVKIVGESDVGFLNFAFSGSMSGGAGKRIPMISTGKLPDAVTTSRNKYVNWKLRWGARQRAIGRTGPFNIFVTIGDPRDPAAVTYKRMEKAVELVGSSPTLDAHDIVKNIMFRWTHFNLDVRYSNEWDLAADMETGAQCIDLVRFVQSVIGMTGAPGVAKAVVVWAQPSDPWTAIEKPWPHGGMSSGLIPPYAGQPAWRAVLLDGDMRPNNYEAALVFTDGGKTRYYPGGVATEMIGPDEVLRVFNCLAWVKPVGGDQYEIAAVPASYQGHCVVGARHAW